LAGDVTPADYLRVVNTVMDALHLPFEQALDANVPGDVREAVRELHEHQATQHIQRVRGVSAEGGPKEWFTEWDPADGYYWPRQRQYLLDQVGRTPEAVEATDDDSDRVLSYLEDPRRSGPEAFNTRGLVIGYVQSGKTENFSALVAKAADVGYQVIIVLSGVHNGLRQQTQRRLERELGLENVTPGVGLPPAGARWNNPTTADLYGDFDPGTSDPSILQGNEKVIFVVKKWHTVLDKLVQFIEEGDPPSHLPVLVIDDEADQASVNTGGNRQPLEELVDSDDPAIDLADEVDPSKTNALIRKLLSRFQRVAYVAYTATPFANVLIDHEAEDREVYDDLFPRDFLLTLFPRPNYVGSSRLFGRDAIDGNPEGAVEGLDVVRFIPGADMPFVTPQGVKLADFVPEIPDSMEYAFTDWLLATGGLLARAGKDHPSSMLIHVHQRTSIQNELAPQVEAMVRKFRTAWRYDKAGPLRKMIRDRWANEFRSVTRRIDAARDMPFREIESHIDKLLKDGVPVLTLNSKTDHILDYEQDPNLKAVLIGGNRLSRGMTIEGLTVSYYVRETPFFDTLLQMARWFGYREWYVDLTRLWTTPVLASWFRDLALREEELREQVLQAERDHLSPLQVGYKIRSHPAMMVTAQNKMGAGRQRTLSYAGTMVQTSRFRLHEPSWLTENLAAARGLLGKLGPPVEDASGAPRWDNVSWELVVEFLGGYGSVQSRTSFDSQAAVAYIKRQVEHGELVEWTIAVATQRQTVKELGQIDLDVELWGPVNAISRSRLKHDRSSIGVLTNPARKDGAMHQGEEEIGLSDEQILAARRAFADGEYERIRTAVLAQRPPQQGLIVLYPISRNSQPRTEDRVALFDQPGQGQDVIGVAIGFPPSESEATIEYVTGSISADEDE
jgi:Z1 domain